ncbi:hypothetical protein RB213_007482, partial [Colletotrichum asianum]
PTFGGQEQPPHARATLKRRRRRSSSTVSESTCHLESTHSSFEDISAGIIIS